MTPEIISNILALLERVDLKGKEVPAFNRVLSALFKEKENLEKATEKIPQEAPEDKS